MPRVLAVTWRNGKNGLCGRGARTGWRSRQSGSPTHLGISDTCATPRSLCRQRRHQAERASKSAGRSRRSLRKPVRQTVSGRESACHARHRQGVLRYCRCRSWRLQPVPAWRCHHRQVPCHCRRPDWTRCQWCPPQYRLGCSRQSFWRASLDNPDRAAQPAELTSGRQRSQRHRR